MQVQHAGTARVRSARRCRVRVQPVCAGAGREHGRECRVRAQCGRGRVRGIQAPSGCGVRAQYARGRGRESRYRRGCGCGCECRHGVRRVRARRVQGAAVTAAPKHPHA
jgi:hypothetical protein